MASSLLRFPGLVGVASAPDFLIHRIDSLDEASKEKFQRDGALKYPDVNQGPYTITKEMYEDADRNRVLSGNTLHPVSCKVGAVSSDVRRGQYGNSIHPLT